MRTYDTNISSQRNESEHDGKPDSSHSFRYRPIRNEDYQHFLNLGTENECDRLYYASDGFTVIK